MIKFYSELCNSEQLLSKCPNFLKLVARHSKFEFSRSSAPGSHLPRYNVLERPPCGVTVNGLNQCLLPSSNLRGRGSSTLRENEVVSTCATNFHHTFIQILLSTLIVSQFYSELCNTVELPNNGHKSSEPVITASSEVLWLLKLLSVDVTSLDVLHPILLFLKKLIVPCSKYIVCRDMNKEAKPKKCKQCLFIS